MHYSDIFQHFFCRNNQRTLQKIYNDQMYLTINLIQKQQVNFKEHSFSYNGTIIAPEENKTLIQLDIPDNGVIKVQGSFQNLLEQLLLRNHSKEDQIQEQIRSSAKQLKNFYKFFKEEKMENYQNKFQINLQNKIVQMVNDEILQNKKTIRRHIDGKIVKLTLEKDEAEKQIMQIDKDKLNKELYDKIIGLIQGDIKTKEADIDEYEKKKKNFDNNCDNFYCQTQVDIIQNKSEKKSSFINDNQLQSLIPYQMYNKIYIYLQFTRKSEILQSDSNIIKQDFQSNDEITTSSNQQSLNLSQLETAESQEWGYM